MADTKTAAMHDWRVEESYWRNNYSSRPYVGTHQEFDYWRPAYRYGYESAQRFPGRLWNDVEQDLRTGWDRYEHRGTIRTTWEEIKAAVRDGWDRMVGNR